MENQHHIRQGVSDLPGICFGMGVSVAIICPGSRNAPLIISFANYPAIQCLSITDERSAGYIALGIAQYSGKPVAIICTSGTAILNLAPSLAEAYYQNLPLLAITADRPREWIDQADGQTIRQNDVFHNYIKSSFELPLETAHPDDFWHFTKTVTQAVDTSLSEPRGPVHINVPLREPLYTALPPQSEKLRLMKESSFHKVLKQADIENLKNKWNSFSKKLILIGMNHSSETIREIVKALSKRDDCLVFAENISNISGPGIISNPEPYIASLTHEEKAQIQPDLLLTIGDSIVSKRFKQFLRGFPPKEHWQLNASSKYIDTYKCLSLPLEVDLFPFLSEMLHQKSSGLVNYSSLGQGFSNKLEIPSDLSVTENDFTDIRIFGSILKAIPAGTVLHLANSTPIRYSQLFPSRSDITYFCNRGTSGIDGCVSTAMGSAIASGKPVLLISGDLAFIYDHNALWNDYVPEIFKIIVINNNGGNIFSLIDQGEESGYTKSFFQTPHRVQIESLARAFGIGYSVVADAETLDKTLPSFMKQKGPHILEIRTDAKENTKAYKAYYQNLKKEIPA